MTISKRPPIPFLAFLRSYDRFLRSYDPWVMLGIIVLSRILIVAIYLASAGPGLSEAEIATAIALP
jgi:hypothetical protein